MVQSSLVRCFFTLSLGLLSVLILSRCSPEAPAPVEVVPAELLVTERVDSVIAAPTSIDYSAVSSKGQGPSGTLIYAAPVFAPNGNFYAYTYDAQRRLIGTYERTSYGYDLVSAMRYEGSLLSENCTGGFYSNPAGQGVRTWTITRYRYDSQHRVVLALMYREQEDARFHLDQTVRYEYGDNGQLQLTRVTLSIAARYNQLTLQYWSDGDVYREERYSPGYAPVTPSSRNVYNQVENPIARLYPWPHSLSNTHYLTGYGPSENCQAHESTQYRYEYDSMQRMTGSQRRLSTNYCNGVNLWGDWTDKYVFTYAP
ncbi:hypothetical protein [Spirosoma pomorum]